MIKYAGVCTLIPTPEVADFLSRYLDQETARNFYAPAHGPEIGGTSPIVPRLNWQPVFHPQINTLIWPTGASRWASMLLLVTKTQLEDIKQLTDLTTSEITRAIGQQLVLADADFQGTPDDDDFTRETIEGDPGNRVALSAEMFALEARPVSLPYRWDGEAWVESSEQTLWLLPIVDKRWFGQWTHVGSPSWAAWSDVISNTGVAIVGSVDVSTIHADYQTPLDTLSTKLKNANGCAVSDAASHLVGQRVVRRIDGTILSLTPTAAETAWDNNFSGDGSDAFSVWQRIAGGDYTDKHKAAATLPEKIRVVYPDETSSVTVNDAGSTQWGPDGTLYTVFADVDLTSGSTAKDDFAARFAEDYIKWQKRKGDMSFAGIKAWRFTGFEDVVIWSADPVSGLATRVVTHPENLAMIPVGGSSGETCIRSYVARLWWNPSEADMVLSVKFNDVTEDINIARTDDAAAVQAAIDAHSEFVAAGVHCTVEGSGEMWQGNKLITLPAGATIVDHTATMTRRSSFDPNPEFTVDICGCTGSAV